jgi:peptide/nickel transport system permease protein
MSQAVRDLAPLRPVEEEAARPPESYVRAALRRVRHDRLSQVAFAAFGLIALLSLLQPLLTRFVTHQDPLQLTPEDQLLPPGGSHWLGTDDYGRDVLMRLLMAGRIDISMGFAVALVAVVIGLPLGLMAAYYGGWIDDSVNALVNVIFSIPALFLFLLIAAAWQPNWITLAVIVGCLGWLGVARQVRGVALSLRGRDYIDAARLIGASDRRIMFRHILPNLISVLAVVVTFQMTAGIFIEVALSFLGLGVQAPVPSWGNMLSDSQTFLYRAPWLVVFPGLMTFITVLCIFLIGDGLRDAFDPRLRGTELKPKA